MRRIKDFSLKKASYIKIGEKADVLIAENHSDLIEASGMKRPKILGAMSNILFASDKYDYTFIILGSEFEKIELSRDGIVKAGAGVRVASLLSFMKENLLTGYEELAGIPGSLGGMLLMNAGANKKCISDNLIEFDTLSRNSVKKNQAKFSYRKSSIDEPIESLTFHFEKSSKERIENKTNEIISKRRESQPLDKPSLGCVFKNPSPDNPAWKLIHSVGMAGVCEDGVCVSKKHANFIVNEADGKSQNFLKLSEEIRKRVMEKHNIKLEYEIEILF
ncbi:MAG: UDP-N-acetylmuramate dehydrogenase [bacterium]